MDEKPIEVRTKVAGAEFAIGALAATGAGFFTNPADVIKIRLQLQGELEARGSYKRIYKNTLHAAYQIVRHEGVCALQAGIVPALGFQVVLNGIRLGVYNTAKSYGLIINKDGNTQILRTVLVSGVAGCVGAVLGSPLYLTRLVHQTEQMFFYANNHIVRNTPKVKTQLQAQSVSTIAVGHQHGHKGTWSAFVSLWREGGIAALYRGWHANIPRLFVGSATQLTTFGIASDWLRSFNIFTDRPLLLTFTASLIGGSCVAVTMQPFDVLATRLYNQRTQTGGKGELYNGLFDALIKIFRTEGFTGLYKGTFPTWMRIAPHTVLCLVFYEQIDKLYEELVS